MNCDIYKGVWPTMITPFTDSDKIDDKAVQELVDWYYSCNVNGLFAVCQSSEMFYLSQEERAKLASMVVNASAGRMPVIASGHISNLIDEQIEEIKRISDTGINAFVIVSNRLANEDESDDIWMRNIELILNSVKNIQFGIYECPYPYKRLMSPELLRWCAETGRFIFLKDTCCNLEQIKAKIQAVKGKKLKVFNANAATLLQSLNEGAAGYSGVMANFHPELYVWLVENWNSDTRETKELQDFLGVASLIERQLYPVNAKYYLQLKGLNIKLRSRIKNCMDLHPSLKTELKQLHSLSNIYIKNYLNS